MSIIDTLITDRTAADVSRAKVLLAKDYAGTMTPEEQAEFDAGLRGAYNAADLNRVGTAMKFLSDRFNGYGYAVALIGNKTDWTQIDIPTPEQLEAYRANVARLRAVLSLLPTTPPTPESMELLDYIEANAIEQILVNIDALLTKISQARFYSGEVYSAEVEA